MFIDLGQGFLVRLEYNVERRNLLIVLDYGALHQFFPSFGVRQHLVDFQRLVFLFELIKFFLLALVVSFRVLNLLFEGLLLLFDLHDCEAVSAYLRLTHYLWKDKLLCLVQGKLLGQDVDVALQGLSLLR